jgi:hypothetical protein
MPYVIGQSSVLNIYTGTGNTPWKGIVSFNFNEGRGFNPLYQLSKDTNAYNSVYAIEANSNPTISITMHSGYYMGGVHYPNSYGTDGTPLQFIPYSSPISCADSDMWVSVDFVPGLCTPAPDWNVNTYNANPNSLGSYGKFFVNSYSFSKEAQGLGQESWSFQAKPKTAILISDSPSSFDTLMNSDVLDDQIDPDNVHMVKGIVTGNVSGEFDEYNVMDSVDYLSRAGVEISYNNKSNAGPYPASGTRYVTDVLASKTVEVSAGALSTGRATVTHNGFVTKFGASTLIRKDGIAINASVNVNLTPVYQVSP